MSTSTWYFGEQRQPGTAPDFRHCRPSEHLCARSKRTGRFCLSISQQIRALEGELGLELFERLGRRVRLTSDGGKLLQTVSTHLGAISEAVTQLSQERTELEGVVTVGGPRTFGQRWLESRLPPLFERVPGIQVHLRFDVPSVLERAL